MGRAARENAWQQLNGSFKRRWPTLTDVDLITANREHLTQNIEDRYGIPRAEAERSSLPAGSGVRRRSIA
jgi:hypothetical protein